MKKVAMIFLDTMYLGNVAKGQWMATHQVSEFRAPYDNRWLIGALLGVGALLGATHLELA